MESLWDSGEQGTWSEFRLHFCFRNRKSFSRKDPRMRTRNFFRRLITWREGKCLGNAPYSEGLRTKPLPSFLSHRLCGLSTSGFEATLMTFHSPQLKISHMQLQFGVTVWPLDNVKGSSSLCRMHELAEVQSSVFSMSTWPGSCPATCFSFIILSFPLYYSIASAVTEQVTFN